MSFDQAKGWVAAGQRIVALTGAGISTDSGIPDFRGPNGVWTRNPKAERMATLDHYMGSKDVRRDAWQSRLHSPAWSATPNSGHEALVELQRQGRLLAVITQNVDGLHQRAGTEPDRVIEVHGTLHEVMCMACGETAPMERALARVRAGEDDPACRTCGGILKSATISFGQSLVPEVIERAFDVAERCDVFLAIGTTLGVYPAANTLPTAKRAGARVVIVNAEPTEMDALADAVLRGSIADILPGLVGSD